MHDGERVHGGQTVANCAGQGHSSLPSFPSLNKTVVFDDLHIVKEMAHSRELPKRLEAILVCKVPSLFHLPLCLLFHNLYINCSRSLFCLVEGFSLFSVNKLNKVHNVEAF